MKRLFALVVLMTCSVHTGEPGSRFLKATESGDRRAQYFPTSIWSSSGDLDKVKYWTQKAADNSDADVYASLAQTKVTSPVSLDYPQVRTLAEKATQTGSKTGGITLARILINTQAGHTDYLGAITLLQNASGDLENDFIVDAQMLFGLICVNGVGIPVDDEKVTRYLKRSSATPRIGYSEYWAGVVFLNGEQGFIVKNKQEVLCWPNLSYTEGFDTGCEEFDRLTNGQSLQT